MPLGCARPRALLQRCAAMGRAVGDLWVFGYASLIWRPEFDAAEHRPALVHGWHRALRMRSRVNRGTPEQPGLVFALLPGGACRGVVYRLRPTGRRGAGPPVGARDAHRRVRPALAALPDAAGRGAGAGLHAQPAQRSLPAAPARRGRCCTSCATPAAAMAARWTTWPKPPRRCTSTGVRDREIERLMAWSDTPPQRGAQGQPRTTR
jgi:cation transport protein ChaC